MHLLHSILSSGDTRKQHEMVLSRLDDWKLLDFISSALALLPEQVTSPKTTPEYCCKFALNMLSAIVCSEDMFVHVEVHHNEVSLLDVLNKKW